MPVQTEHNDRTLAPNYLIGGEVECNRNYQEAKILKEQITNEAIKNYTKNTGQKFQAKSYEWSAVVNLKADSTMVELEELAQYLEKHYGYQCYQIAIHRDEGHLENGEKVINHHAHLEFITLDKETGRNRQRDVFNNKTAMRRIQTEVAKILQMERGEDKRKSKNERVEPRKYAKLREQEKAKINEIRQETQELLQELKTEKLSKEQIKAEFETFRQDSKGKGFNKDFYRELSEAKKIALKHVMNEKELKDLLFDLVQKHQKKGILGTKTDLEAVVKEQEEIIINQQKVNQTLIECLNYEAENRNEILQCQIIEDRKARNEEHLSKIQELEKSKQKIDDERVVLSNQYQEKINKLSLDSIVQSVKNQAKKVIDKLKDDISFLKNQISDLKENFQAKCLELDREKAENKRYQEFYNTSKQAEEIQKGKIKELEIALESSKTAQKSISTTQPIQEAKKELESEKLADFNDKLDYFLKKKDILLPYAKETRIKQLVEIYKKLENTGIAIDDRIAKKMIDTGIFTKKEKSKSLNLQR